jgi:biotin carboxylase
MTRPRVAILDHPRSFFPLDVHEAISKEIEPVWVLAERRIEASHRRLLQRMGTVVDISENDLDTAAEAIGARGPQAIVTFVDDLLVVCAQIAARLGLRAHRPEVAAALIDKRSQRAALRRAGVPGPQFWSVAANPSSQECEIVSAAARFPVVVKEAAGSGSRNMHRVAGPEELCALLATSDGGERIVEEFLPDAPGRDPRFGGYVSVESIVQRGELRHLAIMGRMPLAEPFREAGVFMPGLPGDASEEVFATATAAARALGVRDGMLHTEIKLTPDGPMVIEINGRLGGPPPYVVREATGGVNLWLAACRLALGESPGVPDPLRFERVSYWITFQPPVWATHITRLDHVRDVSRMEGVQAVVVNRHVGEPVDWREGTSGEVMTIRGSVADHDALRALIDAIHETVVIEYGSGPTAHVQPVPRG